MLFRDATGFLGSKRIPSNQHGPAPVAVGLFAVLIVPKLLHLFPDLVWMGLLLVQGMVWLAVFYAAYLVGKWLFLKISVETRELEAKNENKD